MNKLILSLCDYTGQWAAPYREAGYDVALVDLKYGTDVRQLAATALELPPIHGILAAPPCTHFSRMGAKYWSQKDADGRTAEAAEVVRAIMSIIEQCRPEWWVMENPIGRMHRVVEEIGEPVYKFDPFEFGDPYRKRTWLWGRFRLPTPNALFALPERFPHGGWTVYKHKTGRPVERSRTPQGFARAFFEANP